MSKSPPAGDFSGWARWFGLYLGRIEGKAPGLEGPDDPEQLIRRLAPGNRSTVVKGGPRPDHVCNGQAVKFMDGWRGHVLYALLERLGATLWGYRITLAQK